MEPGRIAIVSVEAYGNADRSLALDNLCGALRVHTPHTVKTFNKARFSHDDLVAAIQDFKPDTICLSIRPGGRPYLNILAQALKLSHFEGKVIFGGLSISASPDLFLANYPNAIAVIGEGEEAIVRLCQSETTKQDELTTIPNLVFQGSDGLVSTEKRVVPDRYITSAFDDATQALSSGGICWVESSRSCSYNCSFCSNCLSHFESKWRPLPLDALSRQLERLALEGATIVSFADMNTYEDLKRLMELEELFQHKPLSLKVRFDVRADSIYNLRDSESMRQRRHEALLKLRTAGLMQVFVGYESQNNYQLHRLRKGVDRQSQDEALALLQRLGIDFVLGYMPFDPMMQIEELVPNLRMVLDRGLLKHITTPMKQARVQRGTPLESQMRDRGLLYNLQDNGVYYDYEYRDRRMTPIGRIADYFYFTTAKVYRHAYITSMLRCLDVAPDLQSRFESFSHEYKLLELNLLCDCAESCMRGDGEASLIQLVECYHLKRMRFFYSLKNFYRSIIGNGFQYFRNDMQCFCNNLEDPARHDLAGIDAKDVVTGNTRFRF